MRRTCAALSVLVGTLLSYGCNSEENKGAAPAPPPSAPASAAQAPAAKAPVVQASAAPVASAPPPAATIPPPPPGRSPMPTLDEWNNQRTEVTVKGSSALGCETKILREYLRVSCSGKNDTGGTPTTVQVDRGGRGEAMAFASGGVTTMTVPFVVGMDFAATFSWTDKSHTLVVKWPHNTPKPLVVGVFEGAASPLVSAASAGADKLCACHKQVFKQTTCDQLMGAPNADCERTYEGNCEKLLACSRGESSALPKCMPGFVNAYFGRCFRECGVGKPECPANMRCEEGGESVICTEQ